MDSSLLTENTEMPENHCYNLRKQENLMILWVYNQIHAKK